MIPWDAIAVIGVALLGYLQFRTSTRNAKQQREADAAAKKESDAREAEARARESDREDRKQELDELRELNDRLRAALQESTQATSDARTELAALRRAYDDVVERLTKVERRLRMSQSENESLRDIIEVTVEHLGALEAAIERLGGTLPERPAVLLEYLREHRARRDDESRAETEERET